MKQVIAFPQLGSYFQPLKKLVINLTNLPVMEMPPITKKNHHPW